MKLLFGLILITSLFLFAACLNTKKLVDAKTDSPISKAILAHGGKKYESAGFAFDFRKNNYSFKNNKGQFVYTSQKQKDGQTIIDTLTNTGFTRYIDGQKQNLTPKDATKYGNSLNSVIYFAQIPYKLDDPAVHQTDKGKTMINGQAYQVVQISFAEEGGGTDHDDIFYYWINETNNIIDYLAYSFHVDSGGVRFRRAFNPRKMGGIHFQDYVNYKADKNTPLVDLPALYELGKLKELSKIELENIRVLK